MSQNLPEGLPESPEPNAAPQQPAPEMPAAPAAAPQQPAPAAPQQPAPGAPGMPVAPAYNAAPAPAAPVYNAAPAAVPGKTLGIVGLILAFILPLIGLILSIVAFVQSRKAGAGNVPAIVGMVIGALATIGWVMFIITIVSVASAGLDVAEQCLNGAEYVTIAGEQVACSTVSY